jgi:predicted DNA binding CopG/RHH family protein
MTEKEKRITVRVPEDVYKRFKIKVIQKDSSIQAELNKMILRYLEGKDKEGE